MNDTIRAFIDRINAHDVAGLAELMSDNHTFIDAHGNEVTGKEKMTAGWRAYEQANRELASAGCMESGREKRSPVSLTSFCGHKDSI